MSLEVKTVHDVDGKYFLIKIMLCIEKSNILNQRGIVGFIYIYLYRNYIFKESALGRFFHRVAMSVYAYICVYVPFSCNFFRGLSLALRSHDQIPASHSSTLLPYHMVMVGGGGIYIYIYFFLYFFIFFI